ncbi:glycosyltransferase [Ferribacterium limneticum]|uniref:glycosyltransferase n=1 Tax=Ferribacterium limneticum TaxID=76259 RepID=UPI001CF8A539|nr:glycosyltransferase [Ferribacterium limneticum]UCV23791.1 glycosyltransferase [Ferribacterium limneticum]
MSSPPDLNKSIKLAVLIPSVRWNANTRGLIASTIGTANEEVAVLIGDNSENKEKKEFLRKISEINNNIISVSHTKNIGATDNLCFLLDWCKDVEYVAVTGDDDWMTSCYYPNALETLKQNPSASCCETGTAFVDFGDGRPFEISQPSMTGTTMMQRLTKWDAVIARVTMYSASKRSAIQAAVDFQKMTPLHGLTMAENLWELNRLAVGDFLRVPATSYFIHYPAHGSNQGNPTQRFYNLLCRDAGLAFPALDFMDLCSAIQCALFLMGKLSPLPNTEERFACGQKVFRHIYSQQFIKKFRNAAQKNKTLGNITDSRLRARLLEHISPPYSDNPILTEDVISLFVDLMGHFQVDQSGVSLSHRLREFFDELMTSATEVSAPERFAITADEKRNASAEHSSPWSPMESQTQSYPYDTWLENRKLVRSTQPSPKTPAISQGNLLTIICRASSQQFMHFASTIDSLAEYAPACWQLVVVSDIEAPEEICGIDCIHWLHATDTQAIKTGIDQTVERLGCDWVLEIPCGSKIDASLFDALMVIDQKTIKAVFVDDDIYAESGQQKSPRFKPGVNPAALQSADLAGPICVRNDVWIATGGASLRNGSPWFSQLLRIADRFGWETIKHIPDILISYPDSFPSDTESCMFALVEDQQEKGIDSEIVPATGQSWCIRYPLKHAPSISIIILSIGQLDLLSRCISSIIEKTEYPNFEIIIALTNLLGAPDLDIWLNNTEQTDEPRIRIVRTEIDGNYATRCNAAAMASSCDFFLFLKEETVVIQEKWLEELVRAGAQPGVGGVSPRMIQPGSAMIENAGSVLGLNGIVGAPYQGKTKLGEDLGYLDCIHVARDVSTLPAACMLIRKESYLKSGGMDEADLGNYLAEADLCLKIRRNGERLIYQPLSNIVSSDPKEAVFDIDPSHVATQMISETHAKQVFFERWYPEAAVDPFWNPALSLATSTPEPELEFRARWRTIPSNLPRILAHPLPNGQGDYRVTAPLSALSKAGMASECMWRQRINGEPRFHSIAEVIRLNPDSIIVQNYTITAALAALQEWDASGCRPFTVYALDDLITDMDATNPFRKDIAANARARLQYALRRCDRLVVSTDYLADAYRGFISDIQVVPNRLEQAHWLPLRSLRRTGTKPRIGWAGGTTHQGDLLLLKTIIEQTRDEADWIFFGMCPDEIRPLLAEYHAQVKFSEYPAYLASLNLDIAVAPLAETSFNRGKSNLRLLDYGVLGIPVVCTDIEPYRNSPACRVNNSVAEWTEALHARIHDPDAREREGDAMRCWVLDGYLLENHLEEWLEAHLPG